MTNHDTNFLGIDHVVPTATFPAAFFWGTNPAQPQPSVFHPNFKKWNRQALGWWYSWRARDVNEAFSSLLVVYAVSKVQASTYKERKGEEMKFANLLKYLGIVAFGIAVGVVIAFHPLPAWGFRLVWRHCGAFNLACQQLILNSPTLSGSEQNYSRVVFQFITEFADIARHAIDSTTAGLIKKVFFYKWKEIFKKN